jgi:flagellar basal-body rod modification protein FlgD
MSVNAVQTSSAAADTSSNAVKSAISKGNDEFMMILLAQLKNQNPLEPLKDNELMAQMTQLNSLQELQTISAKIEQMAGASSAGYAASLIGKEIKAHLTDGSDVAGLVTGMTMSQGLYLVNVGERIVPLAAILQVLQPASSSSTNTTATTESAPEVEVPAPETSANA